MQTILTEAYARATTSNYLWNRNRDRWTYLLHSYMGGEEYRKGAYLHRYALESDSEYGRRLISTPLDNQCKSIVSLYNSFLFRVPAKRELGTFEDDPRVEAMLEDADLDGRNMDQFMKDVSTWSEVFGHCWVAVSKPSANAVTLADELAQGVRPYLSVYSPLAVTDWTWQRQPNGSYELTMVKFLEEINDTLQVVTEYSQDVIIKTTINSKKAEAVDVTEEINELGRVPFVLVYAERSPVRGIGISIIDDIADQQRAIYNEQSEVYESIRLDTHPSLAATADTDIGTGAGSLIRLPDNLAPELKPYILEFSGAPIDKIYNSINEHKKMIDSMANVGSVRATETRDISGVALETEFQLLNARLSNLADNLELAEESIWQWVGVYLGMPWTGTVEYPDSFSMRDTGRELDNLLKVKSVVTDLAAQRAIDHELLELVDIDEEELLEYVGSPEGEQENEQYAYPDGELIPLDLPDAYDLAKGSERCDNCAAYNPANKQCSVWNNAVVRPEYWCAKWVPIIVE